MTSPVLLREQLADSGLVDGFAAGFAAAAVFAVMAVDFLMWSGLLNTQGEV